MEYAQQLLSMAANFVPLLIAIALTTSILWLGHWAFFVRNKEFGSEKRFPRQMIMLALTAIGIVTVILFLPVSDSTRGQLLSLLGLLLSAIIALSSTTFVANAMAGIMLRAVGSFIPGDFVRIGEQLGRVTERGLFHMEIQTEDRDLTTLPNLYMVSQPVTVVHASGTIISTKLSLGYDVPRTDVEPLLIEAANKAGLTDSFVQVIELGDYSVVYRIAGFLAEVKQLLSTRSNLCKQVLDTLHDAGIEIVSPAFMNQRLLAEGIRTVPRRQPKTNTEEIDFSQRAPEEFIFDKADKAEKLEELRSTKQSLLTDIVTLEKQLAEASDDVEKSVEKNISRKRRQLERITTFLDAQKKNSA